MKKFKSILVGDLVMTAGRGWRVVGCYYGALGHEDMIGLECTDKQPGCAGQGRITEMMVPADLIPHDAIFRLVDHDEAAKPKLQAVS
jgi:hypothetical protein